MDLSETLIVGRSFTTCGNCRGGADPHEQTHQTLLGWGVADGAAGCGIRWRSITCFYLDQQGRELEVVKQMRPDLEWISPLPAGGAAPWPERQGYPDRNE